MPSKKSLEGIFSTREVVKIGSGTTQRKIVQKIYWYAREVDDNLIKIQVLNDNFEPHGPEKTISKNTFLANFNIEPKFVAYKHLGSNSKNKQVKSHTLQADANENTTIAYMQDIFDIALLYLKNGQNSKATKALDKLLDLDIEFTNKCKCTFNNFAIDLRKKNLYDEALKYYKKLLSVSKKDDENLHFNIARVYYCLNNYKNCMQHLKKALQINSQFTVAKKFLKFLKKQKSVTDSQTETVIEDLTAKSQK
jgi:tetratricopeptide (TPR) repeat protein